MAVPLLAQRIVKKRVRQFKRSHLGCYKCLKEEVQGMDLDAQYWLWFGSDKKGSHCRSPVLVMALTRRATMAVPTNSRSLFSYDARQIMFCRFNMLIRVYFLASINHARG